MKAFFKFLLILLVWALIAAALIGGAILLDLPVEQAILVFLVLLGIWYGFKLIRWMWRRYQARKRVEQLVNVAPDERGLRKGVWRLWRQRDGSEERFRDVLKFLRASRLGRHGDPIYVLPWQLLLGDRESGKDAVITNARLSRPTLDSEILYGGDQEVSWHLYNQGIVLDAPAPYVEGSSSSGSHEDWLRFLMQLEKYRRHDPINGVLIAVSMSRLQRASAEDLVDMAMTYRRLLEDQIQILGVKVPVNLILTHAEGIPGFNDWVESLPEEQLAEPLGAACPEGEEPGEFAAGLMKRIAQRIRELNLNALREQRANSDLLRLPARMASMEQALRQFVGTLFEANHFQETPDLRGIYITAEAPALMGETGADGVTRRGAQSLFVSDLFSRILPAQRQRPQVVPGAAQARRRKARLQAIAWSGAVGLAVVALTTLYLKDRDFLQESGRRYARELVAPEDLDARVHNLMAYHNLIEALAKHSYLPWMAPGREPDFVSKMKADLANRVETQLVNEVDRMFLARLEQTFFADKRAQADTRADISKAVEYAGLLVRRINILNLYLKGASEAELAALPQPFDTETFANNAPESLEPLNQLHIRALVWAREAHPATHREAILALRQQLRGQLDRVLAHAGSDLKWLVAWANTSPAVQGYRLSDLWRAGSGPVPADVVVPRAYTVAGKAMIEDFVAELQEARGDDGLLKEALPRFQTWYRAQYLKTWENFALGFTSGLESLRTREEWLSVINNLTTGRNIYFNMLNILDSELEPYREDEDVPDWVALSNYYQDMRALGPDDGTDNSKRNKLLAKMALKLVGKAGPVGKAIAGAGKSGMKTQQKLAKASASGGPSPDERAAVLEQAAQLLQDYQTALGDFVYGAEVRSSAYSATAALFSDPENPAKGGSPYAKAFESIQKLQAIVGKESNANAAFWKLYKAPLDLMRGFMVREASCEFDELWRNKVLAELEGVPDYKRDELLRGQTGILWNFMNETAQPFLRQALGKGFVLTRAQGDTLAIKRDFLNFVARAKDHRIDGGPYEVDVRAFPASVNLDAKAAISKSTLVVSCPDGAHVIHNYNYPISRRFSWTPACTGVTLELEMSSLTLKKTWQGTNAFPDFLRDFGGGERVFGVDDFPAESRQLRELGVSEILLRYEVDGAGQVLQAVSGKPLDVPQHAASCWAL